MRAFPSIADLSYLSPMGDFRAPVSSSVSTFDPTIISGMAAWWAARKESYANNDPVGTATDWTGNGRSLTQATASKKPLFLTGQKNGLPAFSGDGIDDFLSGGDILDIGTGSIHYFIVAKFDAINGTRVALSKSLLGAGTGLYDACSIYTDAWHVFTEFPAGVNNPVTTGVPNTDWHLFEFVVDRNSGFVELWVDGVQLGTDAIASGDASNTYRLLMFAYSGNMSDTSETFFMQGKIAEVWCWQRVLTDNERDTLRIGAADLYNIPVSTSQFQPNDIAGLVIWQDAAQITGLSDGSSVATWSDYSGNGLSLTAPTVSNQPTYKTSIIGAQPALLFDGVDDELVISSHTFSLTAGTLFAVYKATTGNYGVVRVNNDTAGSYWRFVGDGDGYWGIFYTSRIEQYPAAMPGSNVAASIIDVSTPTVKEVFVNGVSKGTRSIGFYTPDRVNMGGVVNVGSPRMTGYVAEWGMYNHALTGTALTTLQRYLSAKYFTPASIPGLQLWLDASQITGLNNGDPVATWVDQSNSGNNVTQSTAGNRPTYQTNIQNGLAGVQFDGVDDYLIETNVPGEYANTLFIVFKVSVSTTTYNSPISYVSPISLAVDKGSPVYLKSSGNWASYPYYTNGGYVDNQTPAGSFGTAYVACLPFETNWTLYINGTSRGSTTATNFTGVSGLIIGAQGNQGRYLNGFVFEVLNYNRIVTASERAQITEYLRAKWGLY